MTTEEKKYELTNDDQLTQYDIDMATMQPKNFADISRRSSYMVMMGKNNWEKSYCISMIQGDLEQIPERKWWALFEWPSTVENREKKTATAHEMYKRCMEYAHSDRF